MKKLRSFLIIAIFVRSIFSKIPLENGLRHSLFFILSFATTLVVRYRVMCPIHKNIIYAPVQTTFFFLQIKNLTSVHLCYYLHIFISDITRTPCLPCSHTILFVWIYNTYMYTWDTWITIVDYDCLHDNLVMWYFCRIN